MARPSVCHARLAHRRQGAARGPGGAGKVEPLDLQQPRQSVRPASYPPHRRVGRQVRADGRGRSRTKFVSSMRNGQQPWNASFAFNNAVEFPQPIDQRTNDVSVGPPGRTRKACFGWAGTDPGSRTITRSWLGQPHPDHGLHQREHGVQLPGDGSQRSMGLQRLQQRQRAGAGT